MTESIAAKGSHYQRWYGIKLRCLVPTFRNYHNYGGRGIGLYGPWVNDYAAFSRYLEETLGPCPPGRSLDRIDNDGSYEPGNLRWATPLTQARNSRAYSHPVPAPVPPSEVVAGPRLPGGGLSTRDAAALVGVSPATFRRAMLRERNRGNDTRAPRATWPDQRTPLWDAAKIRTWYPAPVGCQHWRSQDLRARQEEDNAS